MDATAYQSIASLISSIGFPIVMCLLMFKYTTDLNETHREETNALKDAINELKVAITTLTERLKGEK